MNPLVSIGLVTVFLIFIYYLYIWLFNTKYSLLQKKIFLKKKSKDAIITNIVNAPNTRYAYGIWVLVNDVNPITNFKDSNNNQIKINGNVIFYRPDNIRVYLDPETSTLYCDMAVTGNTIDTTIMTKSFQLQKWAHILVSVDNQFVDYYFNGKLIKSEKKSKIPLQPGGYEYDDSSIASPPIYLGNAGHKDPGTTGNDPNSNCAVSTTNPNPRSTPTSTSNPYWKDNTINENQQYNFTEFTAFDAYVSKFTRWTAPIDPQSVWNEYLAGNGESFIPYGVSVDILKNNVTETSYQLW